MRAPRIPIGGRPRTGAIVAVAAAVVAVAVVAAVLAARPLVRTATPVQAAAAGTEVAPLPVPLVIPDDATVLVFGDSWTYGSAATDITDGYAYVLGRERGWNVVVDGVRGSGYLKPGIDGPDFGTRIAALDPALDPDLVIVQGSINDRAQGERGYREAVGAAWDSLVGVYPDAQIVVLGPAPHTLPVEQGTARIDRDLKALAADRGWWYISPLEQQWITPEDYLSIIDTGIGRNHPSTAGHAYLAARLNDELARLAAPAAEADSSPTDAD